MQYMIPPWICVGDDEDFSDVCFRMPLPYCALWMAKKWRSLAVADIEFPQMRFNCLPVSLKGIPQLSYNNVHSPIDAKNAYATAEEPLEICCDACG